MNFDTLREISAHAKAEEELRNEIAAKALIPNIELSMKEAANNGRDTCELDFPYNKMAIYQIVVGILLDSGATIARIDEGKPNWAPTVGIGEGTALKSYHPKLVISWEKSV